MRWWSLRRDQVLLTVTMLLTSAGLGSAATSARDAATRAWTVAAVLGLAYSTTTLVVAVRRREANVDVIAWLALAAAVMATESGWPLRPRVVRHE